MTALEQQAVRIAIDMASLHKNWRWKEAKVLIQQHCPDLDTHGWGLACDAYTDRLIYLSNALRN